MLKLIQNEWMKLWQKKGTWAMMILLAAIIIGFSGLAKISERMYDNTEWTQSMQTELADVEKELASPDLDEESKVVLLQRQEELQADIAFGIESIKPQTRESIILDTFGLMSMVTLVSIIVSSSLVSAEFSQGTIKMLLSRPVNRWKILTSKYVTVILFSVLAMVVMFVASVIGAFIFFPGATESTLSFYNTEIATSAVWGKSLYLMFLALINTLVMSTLAFMIGTVFRSTSLAIGISIFLYFTGNMIVFFLEKYKFAKFILFANSNLTQYEIGYPMLNNTTMAFSAVVIVVYVVIFLVLSFLSFTKRDVTA
ncbi:ABC transporter permease [Sporosarcina ureilytica]|uniref:ABC transporter permease n=1 Tax=Sporosarcina ureilytica TaxID=298596 RepID=A0A1D8JCK3_9BACL|nr:ABC transporter permease subunit [Sporosarcina ureilytica]AOV06434.1 hypothetical protein BI350_01630 [Sporosarcina ureilytica]